MPKGTTGPLAQGAVGQASFYLKDLHSDVVGLYGATSGTRAFDAWGEPMGSTGAAADAPLGFQSDWTDPSTGQVDMGTRFYEPTMGRFATQDVLFGEAANPNSLNQYVYGADSPVTMWDPTGMLSCSICNRPPRPDPAPTPTPTPTPTPAMPPKRVPEAMARRTGWVQKARRRPRLSHFRSLRTCRITSTICRQNNWWRSS